MHREIADLAYYSFMAGWDRRSSLRNAVEVYDDMPRDERPVQDRELFVRMAEVAITDWYVSDNVEEVTRTLLRKFPID